MHGDVHGMLLVPFVLILLLQNTSGYKVAPWRSVSAHPQPLMELKGRMQLKDQAGDECLAKLSPIFEKVIGFYPVLVCCHCLSRHASSRSAARWPLACAGPLTPAPSGPQVALLFLIIDRIPHEAVWTEWLGQLEDMMPASFLCDKEVLGCYEGLMPEKRHSVYDAQPYITLYVHPVPQFRGFPLGSIFYKREIAPADRVQVTFLHPP